jgi:hypothetical protein
MVDLEKRTKIGISLTCPLEEAVKLAENKTRNVIYKMDKSGGEWFIHALLAGTQLPPSLHLSRDSPFTPNMLAVTGHHSLDSLNGDMYKDYIKQLESVNQAFRVLKKIRWEKIGNSMKVNYDIFDLE